MVPCRATFRHTALASAKTILGTTVDADVREYHPAFTPGLRTAVGGDSGGCKNGHLDARCIAFVFS